MIIGIKGDAATYGISCAHKVYGNAAIDAVVNGLAEEVTDQEGNELVPILDTDEGSGQMDCNGCHRNLEVCSC